MPMATLTEAVASRRQKDTARVRATAFPALSANTVTAVGRELALKNENDIPPTPHAFHASKVTAPINRVKPMGLTTRKPSMHSSATFD